MSIRRILPRRGTAAAWTAANPILANGEIGYESDTTWTKRGDGVTRWNDLPYGGNPTTWADVVGKPDLVPVLAEVGSYTYDGNGNVTGAPDGSTFTWESDGAGGYRVHTQTVDGVARTFTYNTDGTIASVA